MKLFIDTQYRENYGAHNWDGTGECPQYWKNKGGSTYVVENVPSDVDALKRLVETLTPVVEKHDDYQQEFIIDWTVQSDDTLTEDESLQLKYDGHIEYPSPIIDPQTGQRLNPYYVPR